MILTRVRVLTFLAASVLIYWVPATWYPDQTKSSVNAALFLLNLMTCFILIPDMIQMVTKRGDGMSWQAIFAKTGFFLLALNFSLSAVWSLVITYYDYPDDLLHSAVGGFFRFGMGLGVGGVFFGLNSVGESSPKLTPRGVILVTLIAGIAIGAAVSHIPIGP